MLQTLDLTNRTKDESGRFLEQTAHKDAFEIQEIRFQYAREFGPSEELLKGMRQVAFESGIDLDGMRDVLGAELRYILLESHGCRESELGDK